ncbi:hypothetical protein M0811_06382 [Anaeramoeba ignava]|uniref:Uncharacterized protein n=1 Tax=Anaeramoeba ignava TaxID=1746090 RepID=A0A9Q0LP38_ANAIG|nr:hypothetical protein M0811_06382 [Anaeramoeba ignava]
MDMIDLEIKSWIKEREMQKRKNERKSKFRNINAHLKSLDRQWKRENKIKMDDDPMKNLKIINSASLLMDGLISLYSDLWEKAKNIIQSQKEIGWINNIYFDTNFYEELSYKPFFDNEMSETFLKIKSISNQQVDQKSKLEVFLQNKEKNVQKFSFNYDKLMKIQPKLEKQINIVSNLQITGEKREKYENHLNFLVYDFQASLFDLFKSFFLLKHDANQYLSLEDEINLNEFNEETERIALQLTILYYLNLKNKKLIETKK